MSEELGEYGEKLGGAKPSVVRYETILMSIKLESYMRGILNVLICLLFPIAWGALINWIFTFLERRTGRSTPPNPRIDYHI